MYMNPSQLVARFCLPAFLLAGSAAFAQTNVQIQQFSLPPGQVRLVVGHPRAGATNFTLQASALTNAWSAVPGGAVRALALGQIELTAPRPTNSARFFRVLSVVDPNDADADGLPGSVEILLGTNPNRTDSDGDGYSDGHETVAGTDPLNPNSFPTQGHLPVATFTNTTSSAVEGTGSHTVWVTFDRPFFGTLLYTVNARSTAVAGVDYAPLSGSVLMAGGTTVGLVVTPRDDLAIKPERTLLIDLAANGSLYRLGLRNTHVVRLVDDDAYWNGSLKDSYAERNFRVSIARSNTVNQVCFVAGAAFDGLSALTNEAPASVTSLSEGIIPVGCFNGIVVSNLPARFEVVSPSLPAESGNLFAGSGNLARTFTLLVATNQPGHARTGRIMTGSYSERIGISNTVSSYLDRTNTGILALAREIPVSPSLTNGVVAP
jgi:Bacterial TSP3 repeat